MVETKPTWCQHFTRRQWERDFSIAVYQTYLATNIALFSKHDKFVAFQIIAPSNSGVYLPFDSQAYSCYTVYLPGLG